MRWTDERRIYSQKVYLKGRENLRDLGVDVQEIRYNEVVWILSV
jgi:hypothetical protein